MMKSNKRGFTIFIIIVGMTILGTAMLRSQVWSVIQLAHRQRIVGKQIRLGDIPGRQIQAIAVCERVEIKVQAEVESKNSQEMLSNPHDSGTIPAVEEKEPLSPIQKKGSLKVPFITE